MQNALKIHDIRGLIHQNVNGFSSQVPDLNI